MNPKKSKYTRVTLPNHLADDVKKLMDEYGCWGSMSAFTREAVLEKLKKERETPGKFVPEPIVFLDDKMTRSKRNEAEHQVVED